MWKLSKVSSVSCEEGKERVGQLSMTAAWRRDASRTVCDTKSKTN